MFKILNNDFMLATTIRVRYSETDQMGFVYNANYLDWFEIARTEFCRSFGVPYSKWEEDGVMLPVVECHCRYKHPARYDDLMQLWRRISDIKIHSVTFEYRLLRASDYKLIAEGWTKHGFTDRQGHLYRRKHPFYNWLLANSSEQKTKTDGHEA